MAVASYGSATDSSGVVRILKDLDAPIEGRDVLIVEDIVDSGLTLQYLLRSLGARNPASVEVCALLTKPARRKVDLPTRYVGFEIDDRFAIGYGLDHARALPQPALRRRARRLPERALQAAAPGIWPQSRRGTLARLGHDSPRPRGAVDEPRLQRRPLPDRDRDRAGVLRLEADLAERDSAGSPQLPDARGRTTSPAAWSSRSPSTRRATRSTSR